MGRAHGYPALPGFPAVRRPRAALRRGVARPLAGPAGLADGRVPVRPARQVDRLAQGGADAAPAPVREQYALSHSACGRGGEEPRLVRAGSEPAAAERGLGAELGASAFAGRSVCRDEALQGVGVLGGELDPGGGDEGLRAVERQVHQQARGEEEDAGVPVAGGGAGAAAGSAGAGGVELRGGAGAVLAGGAGVAAGAAGGGAGRAQGARAAAPIGGGAGAAGAGEAGGPARRAGRGEVLQAVAAKGLTGAALPLQSAAAALRGTRWTRATPATRPRRRWWSRTGRTT